MSSFKSKIYENLFPNNISRNYSKRKISPFSSMIRTSNSLDKGTASKLTFLINEKTIFYIFKIIYYQHFPNILSLNSKVFLRNVNIESEKLIQKNINNNRTTEETKSYIGMAKEKILNLYNDEFSFLKESFLNYLKSPKKYELLKDNILNHCKQNYNKNIFHNCKSGKYGNFISIKKNKDDFFLICIKCKKCYKKNYIELHCSICNKEYYGCIFKKIDIGLNKSNRDIYLSTWMKYHCGLINKEIMRCIQCKNYFYYNIKTNKLICENKKCNFTSNPEYIIWKCIKCLKEFRSEAKPFNPYEYRIFKQELYYIILNKNKAKPTNIIRCLNCKKKLNNVTFFHSEECKGEIFRGKLFNKDIIVCSKCLYANYIEEFIWTCPLCRREITNNDNDINNEKKNINVDTNNNSINSSINNNNYKLNSSSHSYQKILNIRKYFKKEKDEENIPSVSTYNSNLNQKMQLNNYTYKKLSSTMKPARYNKKENNFRTIEKDSNRFLRTDTNLEKDSKNFSLSKYSMNNSNTSLSANSKNSLQNKDKKTFHSIIMKMKNKMLNYQNMKNYFHQSEEKIKNENDRFNRKNIIYNSTHLPLSSVTKSIEVEKKKSFRKEVPNVPIKKITIKKDKYINSENEKKNEVNNNNFISVRKAFNNINSNNIYDKYNFSNKTYRVKPKVIINPQKEMKSLRSLYKERKNSHKNIHTKNNIHTDSNIYINDKIAKLGSFYKKSDYNKSKNIINKNKEENNKNTIESNDKYRINKNKNYLFNSTIFDNNRIQRKRNIFNKKDDKEKNNKIMSNLNIYKRKNKEIIDKENNNISNKNSRLFAKKIIINKKDIKGNKENKENKNVTREKFHIRHYNTNNIIHDKNNKVDENNKVDKNENKNKNEAFNDNNYNSNTFNNPISSFRRRLYHKNILSPPKGEKYINQNKLVFKDEEKKDNLSKTLYNRTTNKFKSIKTDNKEENLDKENNSISHSKTFFKTEKQETKIFHNNTVSLLIKKNLKEYFGRPKDSEINEDNNNYGLSMRKDTIEIEIQKKNNKTNKEEINRQLIERAEKYRKISNVSLKSGTSEITYGDNDSNEDEEKKDIITDINIRKVIEHFAHRNSVVKILTDIGNEDSSNNKEFEKKNHFVLEGLINHVNLISSPEKINLLEKHSKIPIFSDDDYIYCENIGEGSNANIYLIKDKKTKEEFALKKMVCQEFNELVKIKKKLELINSLDHSNIMKVKKIQFKCLDFTTYAINTVMDKALSDWNNEIKQRAKNNNFYTEKELIDIAKQVISALAFLQKNNIAHRDIKPQNILIFPNNVYKIADLGEMAQNIKNFENQLTIKGSASFLSPALKNGLEHNELGVKHNAYKSDVFSLGYCFLYAMSLNLDILEKAKEFWEGNKDYKTIEVDIKKYIGNNKYSNEFIDFIGKMILEDENEREDFFGLTRELEFIEF